MPIFSGDPRLRFRPPLLSTRPAQRQPDRSPRRRKPLLAGITAASLRHTVATGERAGLRGRVLAQSAKGAPDPLQQLLVSVHTLGVPGLGEDLFHRFGRHVTIGANVGQERHQTPV